MTPKTLTGPSVIQQLSRKFGKEANITSENCFVKTLKKPFYIMYLFIYVLSAKQPRERETGDTM